MGQNEKIKKAIIEYEKNTKSDRNKVQKNLEAIENEVERLYGENNRNDEKKDLTSLLRQRMRQRLEIGPEWIEDENWSIAPDNIKKLWKEILSSAEQCEKVAKVTIQQIKNFILSDNYDYINSNTSAYAFESRSSAEEITPPDLFYLFRRKWSTIEFKNWDRSEHRNKWIKNLK